MPSYYLLSFLLLMAPALGQDRGQARSMVMTKRGIVATSQTLASQAGAQVLARGGSAADAAIAANAVLGVVEPMMNGIGGDLFVMHRTATGKLSGLNSSGPAPAGLSPEFLAKQGIRTMPGYSIHTVTVPGCVAGWAELHRKFGKLPWADLFRAAIYYAEQGFPVTEIIAAEWAGPVRRVGADEDGAKVFLPGGKPPAAGEVFRNPEMGKALRMVAERGTKGFYTGPIAEAIVAKSKKLGGTMTMADLAEFKPEWVEPVKTTYRGWSVYELPPNSQGVAALSMLNLMERSDIGKHAVGSVEALHWKIESQKLAYADLGRYVADPRFAKVPVEGLISKAYAGGRSGLISTARANCGSQPGKPPLPGEGDTIYLAAVDSEGNIASFIQSVYQSFGSAIGVPGFGFHLHNRGALFTLEAGHPNVLAPKKRPFHTIIPALMEKGDVAIGFGIMGGLNQGQAHAQYVSHIVDHGMNIQAAMEAPRFTKQTFGGCDVQVEDRFPASTLDGLRKMGHDLHVRGAFSGTMGGGQAVMWNRTTGVKSGASDPRKDGSAVPEPERLFQ